MSPDIESFIAEYVKELHEDSAAVFIGAGLSAPAGCVDWRGLLTPVAQELGLNIDHETDLVALAQFQANANAGNRHRLTQLLIEQVPRVAAPTRNHSTLARLPISTYWTTNYDKLIETALREAGKVPDAKYVVAHLATTRPRRDAVIYKMHGDIDMPHEAVLTKDDYERYHVQRGAFINALAGDLVSKTFLFLGFSFTDPNLDYVLSRVRVTFQNNQRRHYAIFKRRSQYPQESDSLFEQAKIRQSLVVEDLKRFNVRTLLVDQYSDVTDMLERIERRYRQRTVFISGSAAEYGSWSEQITHEFLRDLGGALVGQGYRLVTGLGFGIGDAIITGALEQVYASRSGHADDFLVMRPFPRSNPDVSARAKLVEAYRRDLISAAGIGLFVLGNKLVGGKVALADGVRKEFDMAREIGLTLIPVGGSGYMAKELWALVNESMDSYRPHRDARFITAFTALGEHVDDPRQLISAILQCLAAIARE